MKLFKNSRSKLMQQPGVAGSVIRRCVDIYESIYGPVYARRHHKEAMLRGRSIIEGLAQIERRWPDIQNDEQQAPIFILSAGWRSGSTMVQRLIMSKQSVLIWGEPFSHARIISHLADGVSAITKNWPQDEWFIDQYDLTKLDSTFVANMYPAIRDMQQGCLAYFKAMLEEPASQKGFDRWGLKDVRLTIEDAHFLKWLFPNAKFIFLCRNPFDAYKSYRQDRSWYAEWPDKPVFTACEFGCNWSAMTRGFYEGYSNLGGIFLRYEDVLKDPASIKALEDYLDFKVEPSLLATKVGSHNRVEDKIPLYELNRLKKGIGNMASILDYKNVAQ